MSWRSLFTPGEDDEARKEHASAKTSDDVQPSDVQRLAALNRLRLSEEEAQQMAGELGRILSYVRRLNAVDTAGVEPMQFPTPVPSGAALRPDEARQRISRREALENVPDATADGHIRAPSAIDSAE